MDEVWHAAVREDGLLYSLGVFSTESEALECLDEEGETGCAVRDSSSLEILYEGRFIESKAELIAREHWLARYSDIMDTRFKDPRKAAVFLLGDKKTSSVVVQSDGLIQCFNDVYDVLISLDLNNHPVLTGLKGKHFVFLINSNDFDSDASFLCVLVEESVRNELIAAFESGDFEYLSSFIVDDYADPGFDNEDLSEVHRLFSLEQSFYMNYNWFGVKMGGEIYLIQDEEIPMDSTGNEMVFLLQVGGLNCMEIGDDGLIYVFYSEKTGEVKTLQQSF